MAESAQKRGKKHFKNSQELSNCGVIFSNPTCIVLEFQTDKEERAVQKRVFKETLEKLHRN